MLYSIKMRSAKQEGSVQRHISGAERIVKKDKVDAVVQSMVQRAMNHDRGQADFINLKIEEISTPDLLYIDQLPIYSLTAKNLPQAQQLAISKLASAGITVTAAKRGLEQLTQLNDSMHGAMLLSALTGERLDTQKSRGVRVTNMDIADANDYESRLQKLGLTDIHVREALVLASKVQSAPGIKAELCWSDDLTYTTGYVADSTGYFRIPNLKKMNNPVGGRAFFIDEKTDLIALIHYLENVPVLVTPKVSEVIR